MALSQDFEARRRERLQRQRRQRERMRMIELAVSVVLLILVIVIIAVGISRCSKNKETVDTPSGSVIETTPAADPNQAQPVTIQANTYGEGIPAPSVGANDLIDVIADSGEKLHAYLTFDDGPNTSITPQVLDVLRKYNVKATFFMTGNSISDAPYMCTRVMSEGHLAAVHSFSHDYATVYADENGFMDEVDRTYDLICKNAPNGEQPFKLFRFPGGGFDDGNYGAEKQNYKDSLAEAGYYFCDWNCLNGDAQGAFKNADALLEYFNENRPQGKNLIILMHDSETKQETVNMLSAMIEQLMDEGYTFHRLDEIDFSNAASGSAQADNEDAIGEEEDRSADTTTSNNSSDRGTGTDTTSAGSSSSTTSAGTGSTDSTAGTSDSSRSNSQSSSSSKSKSNNTDSTNDNSGAQDVINKSEDPASSKTTGSNDNNDSSSTDLEAE